METHNVPAATETLAAETIQEVIISEAAPEVTAGAVAPDATPDGIAPGATSEVIVSAPPTADAVASEATLEDMPNSAASESATDAAAHEVFSGESGSSVIIAGSDLSQAVDIGWLDLKSTEFYEGNGGFTGMRYKGQDHKRIQLRRAMPDRYPSEFISIADHENKEIGMIRALTDLSDAQLRIVSDELDRRYYCPEILEVKSVRDKLGYVYMEMEVIAAGEKHERSAAVNDVNKNIRMIGANRLIVFDVDGNRYIINALDKLDRKSLRRLEPYMF